MTEVCGRCGTETSRGYSCEHTFDIGFCKECYEQLHWQLTDEPKVELV